MSFSGAVGLYYKDIYPTRESIIELASGTTGREYLGAYKSLREEYK